jgi:hypothetical protein
MSDYADDFDGTTRINWRDPRGISDFWLAGGRLTNPDPEPRVPHVYGLDDGVVYRFDSISDLVDWLQEDDRRERVAYRDARVRKAIAVGLWPDGEL